MEYTIAQRIVGECSVTGLWVDYEGPRTQCPMTECIEGKLDHYVHKRKRWVCSLCGCASVQQRETCDHDCF